MQEGYVLRVVFSPTVEATIDLHPTDPMVCCPRPKENVMLLYIRTHNIDMSMQCALFQHAKKAIRVDVQLHAGFQVSVLLLINSISAKLDTLVVEPCPEWDAHRLHLRVCPKQLVYLF
jgi:hypothetical protein